MLSSNTECHNKITALYYHIKLIELIPAGNGIIAYVITVIYVTDHADGWNGCNTAMQSQKAVTAHFSNKQLLLAQFVQ